MRGMRKNIKYCCMIIEWIFFFSFFLQSVVLSFFFFDFKIGAFAAPDKIHWAPGLPKTRSGKIMRRILRKIASRQLDELGDTSTLADPIVVNQLIELADRWVLNFWNIKGILPESADLLQASPKWLVWDLNSGPGQSSVVSFFLCKHILSCLSGCA